MKRISTQAIYRWQIRFEDYSTSLATREMQMKTTVGYHYTPIRITKIKIVPTPNADGGKEKPHPSYIAGG